jgi:hypothetical protein
MLDAFPVRAIQPEMVEHDLQLLGTGASAPTIAQPATGWSGVTVTRTSAGVYKLTWSEDQGIFSGFYASLRATTPGDLKTFSIVREGYSSSTRSVQFTLYNASGTATDLAALQWIDLMIRFKRTTA